MKIRRRARTLKPEPLFESVQFRTTMIDPPWLERGSGQIKRGADRYYPLMPTPEIVKTIRACPIFRPTPDAHLYLWATNAFLVDALHVVDALGFRYVTNVVWTKRHIGIGRYFRGQHEILLFAVRGRGMAEDLITDSKSIPSVIHADHVRRDGKRVHSAKPPESYALIESRSRGPYAEIFARSRRPGWESWGNEV